MEVSSIGLEELRVSGLEFEAAVFMNLTLDHLEYHKTFENYAKAKSKLFKNLKDLSPIIANRDDENCQKVTGSRELNRYTFGMNQDSGPGNSSSVVFEILDNRIEGLTLKIDGFTELFTIAGEYNAYNIAASYCTLTALGFPKKETLDALSATTLPPGRLKLLNPGYKENREPIVVIDFAHTPDAIENILKTIRIVTSPEHEIINVFGCSGNRGEEKRPLMGAIAEKFSNYVIVTTRHPKKENPEKIARDIEKGFSIDAL